MYNEATMADRFLLHRIQNARIGLSNKTEATTKRMAIKTPIPSSSSFIANKTIGMIAKNPPPAKAPQNGLLSENTKTKMD